MNNIKQILDKIERLMIDLGFEEVPVNYYKADKVEKNYVYESMYCLPVHVGTLGFIVQYAESMHDAQLYMYEDGDCFPLELGEAAILEGIKAELLHELSKLSGNELKLKTA